MTNESDVKDTFHKFFEASIGAASLGSEGNVKAMEWYLKAVQDNASAQYSLGVLYHHESLAQAVRIINRAGQTVNGHSAPSEILYIDCNHDIVSGKTVILWDDVLGVSKKVVHVRDGSKILPFLKGSDLKTLDPLRIAAMLEKTLDVVVEGQLAVTGAQSTSTTVTDTPVQDTPSNSNNIPASASSFQIKTPTIPTPQQPNVEDMPGGIAGNPDTTTSVTSSVSNSNINANPTSAPTTTSTPKTAIVGMKEPLLRSTSSAETSTQQPLSSSSEAVDSSASFTQQNATASGSSLPRKTAPVCDTKSSPCIRGLVTNTDDDDDDILGLRITDVEDVEVALQRIFELSLEAGSLGDPLSQYRVGMFHKRGLGIPQDYTKAMRWFLKASKHYFMRAQFEIGELYYFGHGVSKDNARATEWYLKAAEQGHGSARYRVSILYKTSQGVPQDDVKAITWLLKAACVGHPLAQYEMGELYYYGRGVSMDNAKAMEWYLKAADQGNADAQWSIGFLYNNGLGVPQDHTKAMEWYLKADNSNHARAQYEIGELFFYGHGVSKDSVEAKAWYLKAAEQDHPAAQYSVGLLYHQSMGVEQDYSRAMTWFLKAALQGHALSQYS
ncbi:hypothetical protein BGZ95_005091, partial [Linnemannia exigua]